MKKQIGNAMSTLLVVLAAIAVIIGTVYGYVHNIIALIDSVGPWTGLMIVRVVGIFIAPLGVVLGYL